MTVPQSSITMMWIILIFSIAVPIFTFIYFRRKGAAVKSYFYGMFGFFVFALMLEQIFHSLVLSSGVGTVITNSTFLYALYGGLAAGVFEEGARYIIMSRFMKNEHEKPVNALMYGAGHASMELLTLITVTMITYIMYANIINSGDVSSIVSELDADGLAAWDIVVEQLCTIPWYQYLLSLVERISAFLVHMGLSVFVWTAVTHKEEAGGYFGIAMACHALVDFVASFASVYVGVFITEALIFVLAILICVHSFRLWKQYLI